MDSAKLFFRENPFPASPSSDRYLAIGSVEAARKRLMDAIDRRECPGMLVGPPGTGKTLLCTLIAGAYRNEFDVVLLAESRLCTRKALLQHLLHHLGLPYSDKAEGELRLSLIDRAASGGPASRAGLLIVVDEAHTLPGRLLEELRMMSGIVRNGSPRVQLVLAGGPSLDERFAHPQMEAFSQRIGTRCYLHPLGQNETGEYVRGAIRHAGADPQSTIDSEAIAAVYYAADGIPRLINQTMSRAVALAESESQQRITAEIVQRAWADLQQLPSPVVSSTSAGSRGSENADHEFAVVEFGTLEDDYPKSDPMAETVDYEIGVTHVVSPPAGAAETEAADTGSADTGYADTGYAETGYAETGYAERESANWGSPEVEPVRWQSVEPESSDSKSSDSKSAAAAEIASALWPAADGPAADGPAADGHAVEEEVVDEAAAALEGDDWQPAVVEFGSWEPAVVETAGWEAGVVAAAEQSGKSWLAGESSGELESAEELESSIATDVLALFGEGFEEEEPLYLNLAPLDAVGEGRRPLEKSVRSSEPEGAETALHREIVSINADAVRNQPNRDFGDLPMVNDILIADDSDLLVIEDDIEVETRLDSFPPQRRREAGRAAAEVDFQSLFTRMREG